MIIKIYKVIMEVFVLSLCKKHLWANFRSRMPTYDLDGVSVDFPHEARSFGRLGTRSSPNRFLFLTFFFFTDGKSEEWSGRFFFFKTWKVAECQEFPIVILIFHSKTPFVWDEGNKSTKAATLKQQPIHGCVGWQAYDCQLDYMRAVVRGLENGEILGKVLDYVVAYIRASIWGPWTDQTESDYLAGFKAS